MEATKHAQLHNPLLNSPRRAEKTRRRRWGCVVVVILCSIVIVVASMVAILLVRNAEKKEETMSFLPRGVKEGVSAKSSNVVSYKLSYNWTNAMFSWQRTAFHFQPQKNWMNDPDAPLYHMGWYHLFYQYNPDSAVWGNITWGHAVSRDLIHWLYLPIAMVPDRPFDINGVWTGSATILPDGKIIILYTGDSDKYVQVQNLAYPANLSDPLLLDWVKYAHNPVLIPPTNIAPKNFRDPTTAWIGPDGKWRVTLGSKIHKTGFSLVYTTTDFIHYKKNVHYLHSVSGTGMWECVDFYPVSINGSKGLPTSVNGPGVKHVLKASLDDTKLDHYALGTYFIENDTWVPDNPKEDVGIGLRVDYGRYYASKSFYDPIKERRVLWGWINETDTENDDLKKGWASVQLDIFAEFDIEPLGSQEIEEDNVGCGSGAIDRSSLGPFGLLTIADDTLSELTPIYFRLSNTSHQNSTTFFCADETRSSKAPEVTKAVYGTEIPMLSDEKPCMRVLVDHSIIESFGQGGRRVITSRVYPTEAIYGAARLFLFNNATAINIKASLKIWELNSAFIRPFPFDQSQ